jgi:hypothetical protein
MWGWTVSRTPRYGERVVPSKHRGRAATPGASSSQGYRHVAASKHDVREPTIPAGRLCRTGPPPLLRLALDVSGEPQAVCDVMATAGRARRGP